MKEREREIHGGINIITAATRLSSEVSVRRTSRVTFKLSCKYWTRTRANTIYLLHTVGRSRSTASTVASLSGNSDTHIRTHKHTLTHTYAHARATRNRGLHAIRPRTCKQKPGGNNSYDYGERRRPAKCPKPLAHVLIAKNSVDIRV